MLRRLRITRRTFDNKLVRLNSQGLLKKTYKNKYALCILLTAVGHSLRMLSVILHIFGQDLVY
jgi:hypothetical protein